jgi:hypothetical protein
VALLRRLGRKEEAPDVARSAHRTSSATKPWHWGPTIRASGPTGPETPSAS